MSRRVLCADDTDDIRLLLRLTLEGADFEVVGEAVNGCDAYEQWSRERDDGLFAVVLDQRMPCMTGLEVAARILADEPEQRVIVFSAQIDATLREAAARLGVTACVEKEHLTRLAAHPALSA